MKKLSIFTFLFFSFIALQAQSDWAEINWSNGMRIEGPDENYKLKFGGRIMLDGMSVWPEKNGVIDTIINAGSGVEFRRIRFFHAGEIYHNIKYKLQFDFAGGTAYLKDAYVMITKIPVVGNIQIGHFKEPIGLELLTSSKYISLMERGLTNPLTPERNTGIMLFNNVLKKRMSWAIGYFLPSDNFGQYTGGKFNVSGRVSGTPIYKTVDKYRVLHLGLSLTHQYQNNSLYKLKSRPESHLVDAIKLAEIDYAKAVNQYGFEAAYIHGPFSFQGEYINATALTSYKSELSKSNYTFEAFYVYATFFITGEHRKYKQSTTVFDRVKPKKNFGKEGGAGAWEIAFRYSEINIEETFLPGGSIANITAGVNWHLNPATRIMFNYILANYKDHGNFNIFQMRVQVDF